MHAGFDGCAAWPHNLAVVQIGQQQLSEAIIFRTCISDVAHHVHELGLAPSTGKEPRPVLSLLVFRAVTIRLLAPPTQFLQVPPGQMHTHPRRLLDLGNLL
jgi:hypothetical protein